MVAWQYENIGGEIHKEEIPFVNCSDIVSEEMIENTDPNIRSTIAEMMKCIDPTKVKINLYKDQSLFEGRMQLKLEMKFCADEDPADEKRCMSHDEAYQWMRDNGPYVYLFESRTRIDFSKQSGYRVRDMVVLHYDFLSKQNSANFFDLRVHQTDMEDSKINPFDSLTESILDLAVETVSVRSKTETNWSGYFQLDIETEVGKRVSYGYW